LGWNDSTGWIYIYTCFCWRSQRFWAAVAAIEKTSAIFFRGSGEDNKNDSQNEEVPEMFHRWTHCVVQTCYFHNPFHAPWHFILVFLFFPTYGMMETFLWRLGSPPRQPVDWFISTTILEEFRNWFWGTYFSLVKPSGLLFLVPLSQPCQGVISDGIRCQFFQIQSMDFPVGFCPLINELNKWDKVP
jgi:hypothetical protein